MIQPVLERRPDRAIDGRDQLGIVQPILGLPLELRLGDEDAEDAGQPFADVVGGERHALRRQVVRLDEIPDRLADARAQAVLVRAAGAGGDAVDVAAQVLVGRFGPLQHAVEAQAVLAVDRERLLVDRLRAALGDDLAEVVDDAFVVLVDDLVLRDLVVEGDLHALVQVADDLEPLADGRRVELDLRKDGRVGMEIHRRPAAAGGADFLERRHRLALPESHLPLRSVALDRRDQLFRERVDDRRADAVEPARRLVVGALELAAGVEDGEDHFERALMRLRMLVDRNPAAVVHDRDRRSVLVQRHGDGGREAVHRFVDRVVENLPHQMVQAGAAHAADVHAGPLANGLQTFEDRDVFRRIGRHSGTRWYYGLIGLVASIGSIGLAELKFGLR